MKYKNILWIIVLSLECFISIIFYPKQQKEIQCLESEIQSKKLNLKNLAYQAAHLEELEIRIQEETLKKNEIKPAKEQLIELLERIKTYPLEEIHYKKQKEEIEKNKILKNTYSMSAIGQYTTFLDLIDYIDAHYTHIYIKNLQLDHSVQDLNDPTHLSYTTIYGSNLKNVYLATIEWIVDYEAV